MSFKVNKELNVNQEYLCLQIYHPTNKATFGSLFKLIFSFSFRDILITHAFLKVSYNRKYTIYLLNPIS